MAGISIGIVVFIVLLLQQIIYKKYWDKNLSLQVSFSKKRVHEGEKVTLNETLTNRKFLPLPWVAVKFQVSKYLIFDDSQNSQISDDYYRNDLFSVMMYQKITRSLPFVCSHRGYYGIKSIDLVSNNLMVDNKLQISIPSDASVTVYPRLIGTEDFHPALKKMSGEILARRFINPDPFEFKGIREYQPYDSFKLINFTASAKANKLMVNINDFTVSQEIVILLNLQDYSRWSDIKIFESAIRMAASLSYYYISDGIPVGMLSGGTDVISSRPLIMEGGQTQEHLTSIYESLARIDLDKPVQPITELVSVNTSGQLDNIVYILLSTYHGEDVKEMFNHLRDLGAQALWIVPCYPDMKPYVEFTEDIVKWEVSMDE